jgi:hypothetical protein
MMKRIVEQVLVFSSALLALLAPLCAPALAQCAMCKASAAASGDTGANSLNLAILVLLVPPVMIFCAIFIVVYRYRGAQGETLEEEQSRMARKRG